MATQPAEDFNLLFPLDHFYKREAVALPKVTPVAPEQVPEPYRSLLCGAHDMTPTLEAFHKERIRLRVLARWAEGEALWRLVALELQGSGRPVEVGAIVIHLSLFPKEAQEQVLEGQCPLGTILATHHLFHSSDPQAFFSISSDPLINNALQLEGSQTLYGRRNYLRTNEGLVLADILEILPPEASTSK